MRLQIVQDALKKKNIKYEYTEIDGCGSLDFLFRGLKFHVWEYEDRVWGQRQIFMKQDAVRILRATMKRSLPKEIFIMARYDARKLRKWDEI